MEEKMNRRSFFHLAIGTSVATSAKACSSVEFWCRRRTFERIYKNRLRLSYATAYSMSLSKLPNLAAEHEMTKEQAQKFLDTWHKLYSVQCSVPYHPFCRHRIVLLDEVHS